MNTYEAFLGFEPLNPVAVWAFRSSGFFIQEWREKANICTVQALYKVRVCVLILEQLRCGNLCRSIEDEQLAQVRSPAHLLHLSQASQNECPTL